MKSALKRYLKAAKEAQAWLEDVNLRDEFLLGEILSLCLREHTDMRHRRAEKTALQDEDALKNATAGSK